MKIPVKRECRLCGESFMGTYTSRYCTDAHRQKAYRKRLATYKEPEIFQEPVSKKITG